MGTGTKRPGQTGRETGRLPSRSIARLTRASVCNQLRPDSGVRGTLVQQRRRHWAYDGRTCAASRDGSRPKEPNRHGRRSGMASVKSGPFDAIKRAMGAGTAEASGLRQSSKIVANLRKSAGKGGVRRQGARLASQPAHSPTPDDENLAADEWRSPASVLKSG